MSKVNKNHLKLILVGLFLAALIIGYFFYLNRKPADRTSAEIDAAATAVQEILMTDLENRYPPTPKEVIKFNAEIIKVLYNETFSDEELTAMLVQQQQLFDEDLLAANPLTQYVAATRMDISSKQERKLVVSNYSLTSSVDVDYYVHDGFECARLHCYFYFRVGTQMAPTSDHYFVLRKDGDGHWKILGWQLVWNEAGE